VKWTSTKQLNLTGGLTSDASLGSYITKPVSCIIITVTIKPHCSCSYANRQGTGSPWHKCRPA